MGFRQAAALGTGSLPLGFYIGQAFSTTAATLRRSRRERVGAFAEVGCPVAARRPGTPSAQPGRGNARGAPGNDARLRPGRGPYELSRGPAARPVGASS